MDVEVEVVHEKVTTYLVREARSLEDAERAALAGRGERLKEWHESRYARVSYPVIIRGGETDDVRPGSGALGETEVQGERGEGRD